MRPRETRLSAFGPAGAKEPQGPAPAPDARSVTEVVTLINRTLSPVVGDAWVKGEISGFKLHGPSGHWYFDLKDDRSVLKAAMYRGDNARVKFQPHEGLEVLARGDIAVFAERGSMTLRVRELIPVGQGGHALAFEQLKRRLEAEGIFARRKRELPVYPRRVGVVTSRSGAALRDVVRIAARRFPATPLLICDARVQGAGAAEDVAAAIARLNIEGSCDVIIVGRGGGSAEDLAAFNEEVVVRAVAASRVPIVSAVGHETDITLCDLVADLRAETPSAAAETVFPDAAGLYEYLDEATERLSSALRRAVPDTRQRVDERLIRLDKAMRRFLKHEDDLLKQRAARLDGLSPLGVLARGYAVVEREGRVVRSPEDAPPGSDIDITVQRGKIRARVETQEEN